MMFSNKASYKLSQHILSSMKKQMTYIFNAHWASWSQFMDTFLGGSAGTVILGSMTPPMSGRALYLLDDMSYVVSESSRASDSASASITLRPAVALSIAERHPCGEPSQSRSDSLSGRSSVGIGWNGGGGMRGIFWRAGEIGIGEAVRAVDSAGEPK